MTEGPSSAAAPDQGLCGRPTRSGSPCRQRIPNPRFEYACRRHSTAGEVELATARRDAYYEGYRDARHAAQDFAEFRIRQLEQRIAELEQAAKPPRRMIDEQGRQIVEVGRYAYAWSGPVPLAVGDQVWIPENYVSRVRHGPGAYADTVTALGTDYRGHLAAVVRRG